METNLTEFLADMKTPRCQSTDSGGNQCGFAAGHSRNRTTLTIPIIQNTDGQASRR